MSGPDFAALGTGMDIRQALDVLVAPGTAEVIDAAQVVLDRVAELEQRLNTARRTAWVAVPVEAETVGEGDLIEQKDGTLVRVLDAEHFSAEQNPVRLTVEFGPTRKTFAMPKDHLVPVLRRPTADALDILTRQLGAQATT